MFAGVETAGTMMMVQHGGTLVSFSRTERTCGAVVWCASVCGIDMAA